MRRLVAIASGKGGVGKTWLAISLSHAFAHLGFRTLLIDGDVGLANVNVQLGLDRGPDLGTALLSERPIMSSVRPVSALGLDVLAGRSSGEPISRFDPELTTRMISKIRQLREHYELIVLDLPSGIERGMRHLVMMADDAVILTTEEPTALTDAYALIKTILRQKPDLLPKTIVNLSDSHQSGRQVGEGLSRVCDRFLKMQPLSLGVIRRDRRVAEAVSRQASLLQCYPASHAAKDVFAIAETLTGRR